MSQSKRKPRNVQVINRCKRLECQVSKVRSLFHFLDSDICTDKIPDGELSVAFIENEEIRRLHSDYFNDASITDVITFQGDHAMDFAGEICVCVDVAQETAPEHDLTLAQEITLYLVHGWLHLVGYNDKSESDRSSMRDAEKRIISAAIMAKKIPSFNLRHMK
jgi:probable rRNA maturation factor